MESGRPGVDSGVGGDPCVPNEKSPKLGSCSLVGGLPVRPLAIRCDVCAGQLPFDTPRGQGAPSTIRCIKTVKYPDHTTSSPRGQGAPSTIRCIKTGLNPSSILLLILVREHPAPSGALRPDHLVHVAPATCGQGAPSTIRCIKTAHGRLDDLPDVPVREPPAPPGALRP